jgi:hypothetical protein
MGISLYLLTGLGSFVVKIAEYLMTGFQTVRTAKFSLGALQSTVRTLRGKYPRELHINRSYQCFPARQIFKPQMVYY